MHEWTAEVFAARNPDVALDMQYRLMIRTERRSTGEKRKYDEIEIRPYTDDEIAAHRRCVRRARSAQRRGGEPRWWEDVAEGDEIGPIVKGPLRVTDMICWHIGMGMGLYGVKALRLGYQQRQKVPRFFRPDDLNIPDVQQRVHWDAGVGAAGRQPGRRTTTGGCARRGSSTSAPTGWVTTRGSGSSTASSAGSTTSATRTGCAAGVTRKLPRRRRPARGGPRRLGREPARRDHHARPRDDPAAEPRARPGPPPGAARRRVDVRGSARGAHRALRHGGGRIVIPASVPGLGIEHAGGVLTLTLDRPDRRNAIDDQMMTGLVDAVTAAGIDEAVRVIVLRGAGEHFCAGADIVARNAPGGDRPRAGSIQRRLPTQAHRLIPALLETQVPIVCAVRGWAAGLGFQLALGRGLLPRGQGRALLGAVRAARLHPRQWRDLAAAAARRRRPGARDPPARSDGQRGRGGGLGRHPPFGPRPSPRR